MYVGGVMACTHDHAPLSKRISPSCPPYKTGAVLASFSV
jgi:hypothetical protein